MLIADSEQSQSSSLGETFQNEGQQGGDSGKGLNGIKMAALHRPLYTKCYFGGGAQLWSCWASYWAGGKLPWPCRATLGLSNIICLLYALFKIHTLRVHYAYAAVNLNSGYSKYAKVARVHYFCTIALRTSRAVLTRAWALRRVDLRERRVD